ncbi:MAG: hypothetical protein ACFB2X_16015 [Rivularia sp. (in: cyanobacteria)]
MDKQALTMAIFMGLYVPLFTGISVTIHRWMQQTPQENNKIIIYRQGFPGELFSPKKNLMGTRQLENLFFEKENKNSIYPLEKSSKLPLNKDVLEARSLLFYKFLPIAYRRENNLLQNFDLNQIAIVESKVNLQKISQQYDR